MKTNCACGGTGNHQALEASKDCTSNLDEKINPNVARIMYLAFLILRRNLERAEASPHHIAWVKKHEAIWDEAWLELSKLHI